MSKSIQYLLLFIFNTIITCFLIFLQFLMFAYLPAIDPAIQTSERKSIAMDFALKKSGILIIEVVIGLAIAFFINKRLIKLPFSKNILVLVIDFLIVLFSMTMFFLEYINKFN